MAIALVVGFVAIEAIARVLNARRGRLPKIYRTTRSPLFWVDVNPNFGVWHPANATFHHVGDCFDAVYHTNSYGARDAERARVSSMRRHIVLGDSFVEGYGVAEGDRLTDRLNLTTGDEFLNFGTSGGFGTIQELMLYRTLASTFEHADVLLFVLPVNDFSDNDPRYWSSRRYRPYLRRTQSGFEIYYTVPFESRDRDLLTAGHVFWNALSNHSAAVNLARQVIEHRLPHDLTPDYTSYTGHSAEELNLLTEAVRELAVSAEPRAVHVFFIPLQEDLDGYLLRGTRYELLDKVRARLRDTRSVVVNDLLPAFAEYATQHRMQTSSFFLPCDGHWTSLGNAVAADAVRRAMSDDNQ